MRLMRHKTAELGFGKYDKVEVDELRRELELVRAASDSTTITDPPPTSH